MTFLEELHQQRWDDHRYYHHNRVNQFLHLLSACCFLASYVLLFINPVFAVMVGWLLAMLLRQAGHFFFEPKTYDEVNQATHEYKESVKVGYNLQRKVVLLSIWIAAPAILFASPSLFGLIEASTNISEWMYDLSIIWLIIGAGAVVFRTVHLFFLQGVQPGLVWMTKILTDPFHDVKIYHKSFGHLIKGDMYDDMSDWYREVPASKSAK